MTESSSTSPIYPSEWITGKLAGNIIASGNSGLSLRFKNPKYYEYFSYSKFASRTAARKAAEQKQMEFSKLHKLSRNDYRYLDQNTLQVKLDMGMSMLTDANQLENVKITSWAICKTKSTSSIYVVGGVKIGNKRKTTGFHSLVLPTQKPLTVDHRNGTHLFGSELVLDNKLSNLQAVSIKEQANNVAMLKTNRSGVNGVCLNEKKRTWIAIWQENGKRETKRFCFGPKSILTENQAYIAAVNFRKSIDEQSGCKNGKRPCRALQNKRKAIELQDPPLIKRTTKIITEYFSTD